MRRLATIAVLLLLVLLAAFLWSRRDSSSTEGVTPPAAAERPTAGAAEPVAPAREPERSASEPEAGAPAPVAAATPAQAHVFGRVVDESRAPLADVGVFLYASSTTWSDGVELPPAFFLGRERRAFSTRTDAEGRFGFDVPLPSAEGQFLLVEPDALHATAGRWFGQSQRITRPNLAAGDNDLGDVVVRVAGAVSGRVVGPGGEPVADARIHFDLAYVDARSRDDGSFLLGHATPGEGFLSASADGFLTTDGKRVEVRAGETVEIEPLRMRRAPILAGVVVDQDGVPVADLEIEGMPRGPGRLASTRSESDGRFVLNLPMDMAYGLRLRDQPGFARSPSEDDVWHAPGTTDIRFVVQRLPRTRFRVVDAATGTPILRYGLRVFDQGRSIADWSGVPQPAVTDHADGETVEAAQAVKSFVIVVAAEYAPFESSVRLDGGSTDLMTVRLARGGSLTGTVRLAGAPLARATVRVGRDRIPRDPTKPPDGPERSDPNFRYDLGGFVGRERAVATEADGRFAVTGLAAGSYRVEVDAPGAARQTIRGARVEEGASTDLGELELEPEGVVRGRVLLAPGYSPVGLRLVLDDDWDETLRIEQADGAFEFRGVPEGLHEILLRRSEPAVLDEVRRSFEMPRGGTAEVVIDLANAAPGRFVVRVQRAAGDVSGLQVRWQRAASGTGSFGDDVAKTNGDGVARGACESGVLGRFLVLAELGAVLARSEDLTLAPGVDHEVVIAVRAGAIAVHLPPGFAMPASGRLTLELRASDGSGTWVGQMEAATPGNRLGARLAARWTGPEVELGEVEAGAYLARVWGSRFEPDPERANRWIGQEAFPEVRTTITVREGETTVIEVAGAR